MLKTGNAQVNASSFSLKHTEMDEMDCKTVYVPWITLV